MWTARWGCSTTANWEWNARYRNRFKTLIRGAHVLGQVKSPNNMGKRNRVFSHTYNSIQDMERADGSDTAEMNEIMQLFIGAFSEVYKANDNRPEPRID